MIKVSSILEQAARDGVAALEASGEDIIEVEGIIKVIRDGSPPHEERKKNINALPIPFEVNGKIWWVASS